MPKEVTKLYPFKGYVRSVYTNNKNPIARRRGTKLNAILSVVACRSPGLPDRGNFKTQNSNLGIFLRAYCKENVVYFTADWYN
jgi:hypothetical protein